MKHEIIHASTQLQPHDCNHPEMAKEAITLCIPDSFSESAMRVLNYLGDAVSLFQYQGSLVLTDESLELASNGEGIGPRWVGDSLEELEAWLEATCEDYDEHYANILGWISLKDPTQWE